MKPGLLFHTVIEGVPFRVICTVHFVARYEIGDPPAGRQPVKHTVSESVVRAKIEEALPEIADIAAGDPDAMGVIVSRKERFIMVFALVERQDGFQVSMVSTSPGLAFRAKSPKDYVITVNPTYEVAFVSNLSYALKVSILADLAANAMDLEDGGTFHLGGELMDYWVERTGMNFQVIEADWAKAMYEVQVS